MKNLLFTLVLLFSSYSYSQFLNAPIERSFYLQQDQHYGESNQVVVPDGKAWLLVASYYSASGVPGLYEWTTEDPDGVIAQSITILGRNILFTAGFKIWSQNNSNNNPILLFVEYNLDNQGLSYNNPNLDNKIRLFPNPTTSEVALNSDKQYDIEVYDILGNKVMELTGNTIDMEHLSSATYIVNALDTETNEILSYKVIKH